MAGYWIRVEHVTPDKPEVHGIADALGIDPDAVVGKLIRLWIWADQQTVDGNVPRLSRKLLDRITGVDGFADAMIAECWLSEDGGNFMFPNFGRLNGESSKKRAETAQRVAKSRATKQPECNGTVTQKALQHSNSIPRPIRRAVFERDDGVCTYCNRTGGEYTVGEIAADAVLSVDHIIPIARGGDSSIDNLTTCCMSCNNFKNNRTPQEAGLPWPKHVTQNVLHERYNVVTRREEKREDGIQGDPPSVPPVGEVVKTEKKKRKKRFIFDDTDRELANKMREQVLMIRPNFEFEASIESWANDFRLLRSLGGDRTPECIAETMQWIYTDNFWCANILCPSKLRKKWDEIRLKMDRSRQFGSGNGKAKKVGNDTWGLNEVDYSGGLFDDQGNKT